MKALNKDRMKTSDSKIDEVENKLHWRIVALMEFVENLQQENTMLKEKKHIEKQDGC